MTHTAPNTRLKITAVVLSLCFVWFLTNGSIDARCSHIYKMFLAALRPSVLFEDHINATKGLRPLLWTRGTREGHIAVTSENSGENGSPFVS